MSPYIWMPHMSGYPPVCLNVAPVCLDDVWMLPVHTQHKKACFVTLRECPYAPILLDAPICLDTPCMFGCTPVCLDAPICLDGPLYV